MPHRPLIALTLTALSVGAYADHRDNALSYDVLEYRYQESELDAGAFDIDGDGYVLAGSVEISNALHVFAGFDKLTFDDNVELKTTSLGIGWAFDLSARTDIVLRAGIVDAEFNTPTFTADDFFVDPSEDGVLFSAGVRSFVRDDIELYASLNRFQFEEFDDEESVLAGLDFYFSDSFAIGPAIHWVEDTTTWSIGGKFYF
ncbi:MAG: hypothetical protein AAF004_03370 [Pseudomonadota bacterium]